MNLKRSFLFSIVLFVIGLIGFQQVFEYGQKPQIAQISSQGITQGLGCIEHISALPIDHSGTLSILVWNIYKQNRPQWSEILTQLSHDKHLLLLQEASLTPELKHWIEAGEWNGNQADAFRMFDVQAGVLTLASQLPEKACAYTQAEPWILLPKSALYTTYLLSNGQKLAVVNIHSVNFTLGTKEYQQQLTALKEAIDQHEGPVILGGDFNSWSEERMSVVKEGLSTLGLKEVSFSPDNRTQFFTGYALDHLFYRGLKLESAEAPKSGASDHNPLLARFSLL